MQIFSCVREGHWQPHSPRFSIVNDSKNEADSEIDSELDKRKNTEQTFTGKLKLLPKFLTLQNS